VQKLLVLGANGQVGRALKTLRPDAMFLDSLQADLATPERLTNVLKPHTPDALINAAAYTQVDKAEEEEDIATRINAQAPLVMAEFCAKRKIPFVTYSTDYVFNGSGDRPWVETDMPAPLNAYGRSKLKGEHAVESVKGDNLILRTSWVYDAHGKNFVNTILRHAAEREELRVIDDQYGAPTYAPHLAQATLAVLAQACEMKDFPTGTYHLCSGGVTTWYGFAVAIIEHARSKGIALKVQRVVPIPAIDYPLPARRPMNSRLDCAKALSMFGIRLPDWQEGVRACMDARNENH
jgi:dTDP-4-dehydrorhamnose reductase